MKSNLLAIFVFLVPASACSKVMSYFLGEKFKAEITYACKEGSLTCKKVYLKSTKINDNSTITLKGETINTNCPNVCDFQGYEFKNGKYNYSFYPSLKGSDLWDYIVTLNDKVIAKDSGVMK